MHFYLDSVWCLNKEKKPWIDWSTLFFSLRWTNKTHELKQNPANSKMKEKSKGLFQAGK